MGREAFEIVVVAAALFGARLALEEVGDGPLDIHRLLLLEVISPPVHYCPINLDCNAALTPLDFRESTHSSSTFGRRATPHSSSPSCPPSWRGPLAFVAPSTFSNRLISGDGARG